MTEPVVDGALVRAMVAEQLPHWGHLPVQPVAHGGNDNRTFRLGTELVIRMPAAAGYASAVAKEQRWLPRLAPRLPLPIPTPVALGQPSATYPYAWSVYRWLDGQPASVAPVSDPLDFAVRLGGFLNALRRIDASGGPAAGQHSFFRGAPLRHYEQETLTTLDRLGDRVAQRAVRTIWARARSSQWNRPPVWFHGDVAAGNLLLREGRLAAVIDFGTSGVGDPACDLVIAWTFLDPDARALFRTTVGLDPDTWDRAKGWALWKSLITLAPLDPDDPAAAPSRHTISAIFSEPVDAPDLPRVRLTGTGLPRSPGR